MRGCVDDHRSGSLSKSTSNGTDGAPGWGVTSYAYNHQVFGTSWAGNSRFPAAFGDGTSAPASTQSETSVAVDATGQHVVVGFNDFRGSSSFSGFEYSDDGGTTFTDGGQLAAPPLGTVDGDPDVQYVPGGSLTDSCKNRVGTASEVSDAGGPPPPRGPGSFRMGY